MPVVSHIGDTRNFRYGRVLNLDPAEYRVISNEAESSEPVRRDRSQHACERESFSCALELLLMLEIEDAVDAELRNTWVELEQNKLYRAIVRFILVILTLSLGRCKTKMSFFFSSMSEKSL